jgi:MFS family permease
VALLVAKYFKGRRTIFIFTILIFTLIAGAILFILSPNYENQTERMNEKPLVQIFRYVYSSSVYLLQFLICILGMVEIAKLEMYNTNR